MYKPETTETLEQLQARKKEVLEKIKYGTHLDALSMDALYRQLSSIHQKIEAHKGEGVSNG